MMSPSRSAKTAASESGRMLFSISVFPCFIARHSPPCRCVQVTVQLAEQAKYGTRRGLQRGRDDDRVAYCSITRFGGDVDDIQRRNRVVIVVVRSIEELETPAFSHEQPSGDRIRLSANAVGAMSRDSTRPAQNHRCTRRFHRAPARRPAASPPCEKRGRSTGLVDEQEASKFPPAVMIHAALALWTTRSDVASSNLFEREWRNGLRAAPASRKSERGGYENPFLCTA